MLDDNTIDELSVEKSLKLLLVEVVTFVSEIEEFYSITKDIEDKIKQKVKLMEKNLCITRYLIDDEVFKEKNLDNENMNIDRFSYLDEKSILDGLIYIIYSMVKVQISLDVKDITEFTQERIKNRLKSANKYFRDIDNIYYRNEKR